VIRMLSDAVGRCLRDSKSGMALVEFALVSPFMLSFVAGGTELANYTVKSTQVGQLALHVADNGARIGEGAPLALKQINEGQIEDLLVGADINASGLNIYGTHTENGATVPNGRIVISSLEGMANPNTTDRYKIAWQRCRGGTGSSTWFPRRFGVFGAASGTNMTGMGPAGRQVKAPDGTPVIFVEVYYRYQPLFFSGLAIFQPDTMVQTASMMVRDSRDLSQVYATAGAPNRACG